MPFQIFEQDARWNPSYPQSKPVYFIEPRCRYEQFEFTPFVNDIIMELQERAKNSPETIDENRSGLLVYWPEDNFWYYCAIKRYNKYEDKFDLSYDDGADEAVHLWEEKFLTMDKFNQIKDRLEQPSTSYEKRHMYAYDQPSKTSNNHDPYMDNQKRNFKRQSSKEDKPEKFTIDGFTILAQDCSDDSEDSFIGDKNFDDRFPAKTPNEKNLNEQYLDKKNGMLIEGQYTGQSSMPSRAEYNNTKHYKSYMYSTNQYSLEDESNFIIKSGPFETMKVPNANDTNINDALRIEQEEWEQIYTPKLLSSILNKANSTLFEPLSRASNANETEKVNERGYPTTRAAKTQVNEYNKDWIKTLRQKHLLPSAQRIRRDMKLFEKRFYERYLSSGYKLWECPTCETLELKFMICEDRDPMDFINLHEKYLQNKIQKENVTNKNGLYQNQTIIFVNKASI